MICAAPLFKTPKETVKEGAGLRVRLEWMCACMSPGIFCGKSIGRVIPLRTSCVSPLDLSTAFHCESGVQLFDGDAQSLYIIVPFLGEKSAQGCGVRRKGKANPSSCEEKKVISLYPARKQKQGYTKGIIYIYIYMSWRLHDGALAIRNVTLIDRAVHQCPI